MLNSRASSIRLTRSAGFTLIEVLVVIVIVAVVTSIATFGFSRVAGEKLHSQRELMQLWLQDLAAEALLTSSTFGIWVDGQQLQPLVWDGEDWLLLEEPQPFVVKEPVSLEFVAVVKHDPKVVEPDYMLLPTGQVMPEIHWVLHDSENELAVDWPPVVGTDGRK